MWHIKITINNAPMAIGKVTGRGFKKGVRILFVWRISIY